MREAAELTASPSPDYTATPLDDNLFEWHFTLRGPPGSGPSPSNPSQASSSTSATGVYSEGIYHGRIVLPPTYPLRPPSFRFFTPSGRFECNREICLSISGHHEETWQPAWGLRTALVALRTFMETEAKGQLGGIDTSDDVRRRMASESKCWKCSVCAKSNEQIIKACEEAAKEAGEEYREETVPDGLKLGYKDELGKSSSSSPPQSSQEKQDSTTTTTNKSGESQDKTATVTDEAHLAEGFLRTYNPAVATPTLPYSLPPIQIPTYPHGPPAQGVPQPTAAIRTVHVPPQVENAQVYRSNDGVPGWLDKLIAVNVAFLAFFALKWVLAV